MESLLSTTAELLSQAAADPDRVLKWVLIYFCLLYTSDAADD